MAYAFFTQSGTLYKVEDSTLCRIGEGDILRQDGTKFPGTDRFEVRVRVRSAPRVGECAVFETLDGSYDGKLTTSPIKSIHPILHAWDCHPSF